MTAEYGSGRYVPVFTSSNVAVLTTGGAFSVVQTRTFWLYLLNEAGVSLPSPAVTVAAPIGGRISVSFPETNRDTATGYKYCFIVASLTTTLADAWVVGFWRLFQTDSDAFATAAPIVFSRNEQLVVPPAAVSLPAGLPTGVSLVPGMVRLVSGGVASGASYYIYYPWLIVDPNSPYFRRAVDGDKVIERSPGEYWVRFGNPNFGLFPIGGDIFGDTGACRPLVAVDEEFLAQNLLFGANYAAADNTDSVAASAKGLTVFFGSDTGDDILAGSRFGLNIQVDGFPATTLFDRRIVVRFLGFYNPVTGVLDTSSGLSDGASMAGVGVDMTQTNSQTGFLAISKTLPGIQKAVFKIFPRFRASEIYPPLVQGSVVSIVPILLPQGGTRVPLASIFETSAGGFVAPIADFGRVVPGDGTLNVLPGLFVVRGHESALQPKQTIAQITPNTLNQQLAITQDGRAVVRGVAGVTALSGGEALLALFDFGTGESVASGWSNNIVLSAAGGISITATYPVSGAFGMVRSGISEIAGNTQGHFNPPQVRIYIKQGSTIYRLNSPQPVVIGTTQVFTIAALTNTTVVGATTAPPFTDFCLFDPPTVVGSAIGGSLPIGTYQIAIAYSFLSGTQCTRIRQATADGCIPAYRRSLFESNTSPIIQAIELLSTAGLIERTAGGSAAIIALSSFVRSLLGSATDAAARTTLNLGNVNNTLDISKPVSTAQQTALNLKADIASPNFTGTPFVPTATAGTNTLQIASTAFVRAAITNLVNSSPATLDTLGELATALGNDPNFSVTITNALALKVNTSSLATFKAADAELIDGIDSSRIVFGDDFSKTIGASQTPNIAFNTSGFIDIYGAANSIFPAGVTHINGFQARHRNSTGLWGMQAGCQHNLANEFYFRTITGDTFNPWRRTWNDGNFPVEPTPSGPYGSIGVIGGKNTYAGISFLSGFNAPVFMVNQAINLSGMWTASGAPSGWHWYYQEGSFRVFNSGVASDGSFIGLEKGLNSLPGYPANSFPTVRTDFTNLYFSAGGVHSAVMTTNGVWQAVSDRNKKENFEEIPDEEILELLLAIPTYKYNFKDSDARIKNYGCMAQDFYAAFKLGGDDEIDADDSPTIPSRMMATSDVVGVCMAAIKGLNAKISRLENDLISQSPKIL
jgi:hypothetical protein